MFLGFGLCVEVATGRGIKQSSEFLRHPSGLSFVAGCFLRRWLARLHKRVLR